ncbi:MAG: endonuclease/exonuclease/phosphatase family protein [Rikenellaceae bacterium]
MADYYYNSYDRKQKRRSLISILFDVVILMVSLVAFAAMSLTLVTSYYDPSLSWVFPVLGLVSPAVYIVTALLAFYWVIRWRLVYAVLLLLPLLVGAPSISRYFKIDTSNSYGEPSKRGVIKLISYNVKGLVNDKGKVSTEGISEYIEELRPDIVCFQEFQGSRMKKADEPQLFSQYNRVQASDLAIFTRYKILDSSDDLIHSDFDSGCGMWADLLVGSDTIRLYNIHLQSTAITVSDDEYIRKMEFIRDSLGDDKLIGMLSRFRNSSIGRAAQADTIALSIEQSPYRVIVCGDFNDTPNSYTYRKISHGLQDAFQEVGVGYSHTFRGFLNLLRIDYVLFEKPTQVLSYEVADSVQLSDHLPVVTTFKL